MRILMFFISAPLLAMLATTNTTSASELTPIRKINGEILQLTQTQPTKTETRKSVLSTGIAHTSIALTNIALTNIAHIDPTASQFQLIAPTEQTFSIQLHQAPYIYDAWVVLSDDLDHDNHYQTFSVFFDADIEYGQTSLFAKVYLKGIDGEVLLLTTPAFAITGDSDDDYYEINTRLINNHPSAYYQITIDLYDAYTGEWIERYENDADLWDIPLEEQSLDAPHYPTLSLFDFSIIPLIDDDADGFYHSFDLHLDLDIDVGSQTVYAELLFRPIGGNWQRDLTTPTFTITGDSNARNTTARNTTGNTSDELSMTIEWSDGYNSAEYEFMLNVYNYGDDSLLLTANSSPSTVLLFESQDLDHFRDVDPSSISARVDTVSYGTAHGGGIGIISVFSLMGLIVLRKRRVQFT